MSATDPRDPSTRNGPRLYTYYGLDLYIVQIAKGGVVHYIDVSYREPRHKISGRHRVPYGNILFSSRFVLDVAQPIPAADQVPDEVIFATLDRVIPTLFLPRLFLLVPALRTPNAWFGLMAPYTLYQIHGRIGPNEDEQNYLRKMISLWGELPIRDITPSNLAPELTAMAPTTAKAFIRLLRKIYPCMVLGTTDTEPGIWDKYHFSGHRNSYSTSRVIRTQFLNKPLSPGTTAQCIKICINNIWQGIDAAKYLIAMTILTEGIELSEACALRRNSLVELENYPGRYALAIRQAVLPQGTRQNSKGYQREQRHVIADLEPPDYRSLGVSGQLADAWQHFLAQHPGNGDDLLLVNSQNTERVFHPDDFSAWLDSTFGHLMPTRSASLLTKEVSSSYRVAQYFIETAHDRLSQTGRYSSEELRYHFAKEPLQMDGKKYVGFCAPAELVTMGDIQHAVIAALVGGAENTSRSRKKHTICGTPHKISHIRIRLQMNATGPLDEGILLRLGAQHGFRLDATLRASEN